MKIGIFDPYLDTLGGGEKYMLTAASILSKNNKVSIFWNDNTILEKAHERFGLDLEKVHITPNIFTSHSLLQRIILTEPYDVIFYLSDGSIPFVGAKRLYLHFQFPIEWIGKPTFLTSFKMRRVARVICNSQFTKSYIDKTFHTNSSVLYPPIDGFSRSTIKKKNIILSVGRFQKNSEGELVKKQDLLMTAFQKMVDKGLKGWELVLAGGVLPEDRSLIDELHAKVGQYPITIADNVSLGYLHKTYSEAKIYWHAAGWGEDTLANPERAEHFGITTVEAMERGVVPVVINKGGQKEIVTDEEDGFLWDTPEELMQKTQKLIKSSSLWNEYSESARKTALSFSTQVFAEELKKLIV